MREKNYPYMYWCVDLHDTIIKSTYSSEHESEEFYPGAKEVLQYLSSRKDMVLILFTSSFPDKMVALMEQFRKFDINFKYLNANPECPNTPYGDFSRKFYYDILLDDKAGFIPEQDWIVIRQTMKDLFEWHVLQHDGDCSIWIPSDICDCGALRRYIRDGNATMDDPAQEAFVKHEAAIDRAAKKREEKPS